MIRLFSLVGLLLSFGLVSAEQNEPVALQPSKDLHMSNMTQLTFEGDNGEAYFSFDGERLIYQSNRGGYQCDKIWIMNIDGSGKHMVSPDHGAHTCAFFFPGGRPLVFASTSHLDGACPPKPSNRICCRHSKDAMAIAPLW